MIILNIFIIISKALIKVVSKEFKIRLERKDAAE